LQVAAAVVVETIGALLFVYHLDVKHVYMLDNLDQADVAEEMVDAEKPASLAHHLPAIAQQPQELVLLPTPAVVEAEAVGELAIQ
jgi:hypothetical protein